MVAGIHNEVGAYFRSAIREEGLMHEMGKHVVVLGSNSQADYFRRFNRILRSTDILWSKPSELSFYTALGIPLIIAPPIGSQERFNETWVASVGSGAPQEDPQYAHEWLFDWLNSGWLAEAAMEGFIEAPKFGTYNIAHIISHHREDVQEIKTLLPY